MRRATSWFKSGYSSGASNNCVETRIAHKNVDVRDSAHPQGTTLTFDSTAWRAFLGSVRNNEL
ncbi:DUF397 domain-containing protein [Allosalinactinospora lopnorensis]|uniref:DUF397 domain-containing protein n=1 Tax=Allosalinactinospora lopnorensis TaxID=1352348 RepID=UPI000623E351|nr:DUF397 domain-containing protein [Allosalinactinospora lopnorensis]